MLTPKLYKIRMICTSFLMLLSILMSVPAYAETSDKSRLDQMIRKTKQEILKERNKERSVMGNLLKQQRELAKLEQDYEKVKDQLDDTRKRLDQTQLELSELREDLYKLENSLEERRHLLNYRLAAIYKYGPQSFSEILMTAKNFADFISRFTSIAYFVKNDLKTIKQFVETKEEVIDQKEAIEQKKKIVESEFQKVNSLQREVYSEQQKIVSKVLRTKEELAKIQNNRAKLEKALEEYEQTSREIEAQIKKGQVVKGKVLGSGSIDWPARGRISSPYGWRYHPVLKRKKLHNGLDIAVPSGTPVYAADSGVVLVSGWRGGYGNFIAIDHGGGISTCYGHNSRLLVKVGESVYKGQKIALSGNTGLSTGPHLHFEVRVNGTPSNPLQFLP